jgi:hypothetical protein
LKIENKLIENKLEQESMPLQLHSVMRAFIRHQTAA